MNVFGDHHSDIAFKGVAPRWEKRLTSPTGPAKKKHDFDPRKFLATVGQGRKVIALSKKQTIFTQGDAADAVF